jgi:hypothetical protein
MNAMAPYGTTFKSTYWIAADTHNVYAHRFSSRCAVIHLLGLSPHVPPVRSASEVLSPLIAEPRMLVAGHIIAGYDTRLCST